MLSVVVQGASHVTLSDRFEVLYLLEESVKANEKIKDVVSVEEISWGEPQQLPETPYDLIVASEVIYNGHLYDKLLRTIVDYCSDNTVMVMSFERRSSEDQWLKMVREKFAKVDMVTKEVKGKTFNILKCEHCNK